MDKTILPSRIEGSLTPPCSKSYAQRSLAVALLCEGTTTLRGIELCDDTLSAMGCIESLGAKVKQIDSTTISIEGGLKPRSERLFIGESGLSTRLFTPIAALCHEPITIDGHGSILDRPMEMMIEPLRKLGVIVDHNNTHLPIEVCGPMRGGEVEIDGSASSQFITGLLLSLPLAEDDTTLHVKRAVSRPYLDMTIATAQKFGVEIAHNDYKEFFIEGGQRYTATDIEIETDWSAAATMLVAAAIAGEVTIHNISTLSKQADTSICIALARAGAEVIDDEPQRTITVRQRPLIAFTFDATHCPDLFPALAALAAAAEGVSTITGTSRLVNKESNRALTLQAEYAKLGIEITLEDDNMHIRGGAIHSCSVESHNDHRIAMSLAISALRGDGEMIIKGAECVAKSYPSFFEELEKIMIK